MAFEDLLHPYVGRYMESPEWVKASAGRAYAWLPPRLRYGAAYDRFREEAPSCLCLGRTRDFLPANRRARG